MESQANKDVSHTIDTCNKSNKLKTESSAEKEPTLEHQEEGGVEKSPLQEEKSPQCSNLGYRKLTNYSNKKMNQILETPSNENEKEQEIESAQNKGANKCDLNSDPSLIKKAVYNDKTISEEEVFQVLSGQRSGRNREASPYRPNTNNKVNRQTSTNDKDTIPPPNRILERPNSWHGIYPGRNLPPRVHNVNSNLRCAPYDQSKYSYNTSEYGCPYRPPTKPIVSWVACSEGRVQPGAIVAGREFNNPYTFIGRVTLRNEQYEKLTFI